MKNSPVVLFGGGLHLGMQSRGMLIYWLMIWATQTQSSTGLEVAGGARDGVLRLSRPRGCGNGRGR